MHGDAPEAKGWMEPDAPVVARDCGLRWCAAGDPRIPFDVAYLVVAWLCWVPNLVVAEAIFRASPQPASRPAAAAATTG